MEVLCMLNLLAQRVASSSAPRFVAEIARFVTASPSLIATTSSSAAAPAQHQQGNFGVFSSLLVSANNNNSGTAGGRKRTNPAPPHHRSGNNNSNTHVRGGAGEAQIPLAVVVGGVAQDLVSSGGGGGGAGGGGRNSLVDAIFAAGGQQQDAAHSIRVVSLPNDPERVSELLLAECSSVAAAASSSLMMAAGNTSTMAMTTTQRPSTSSSSMTTRIVAVFQMGDSCHASSEELGALSAALVELVSCRVRFGQQHCSFSAVVVVRSPWFASVLLSALAAPPLQGTLNPQVFENDSSGENTFPAVVHQTVRHFPFFVMSEEAFRAVCVSWNCAHRMQDLVHALHTAILAHLAEYPDLDDPVNRANAAAVREVLAYAAESAAAAAAAAGGGGVVVSRTSSGSSSSSSSGAVPPSTGSSGFSAVLVANSFCQLYYEVLVRKNVQILSGSHSSRRAKLVASLRALIPKMATTTAKSSTTSGTTQSARQQQQEQQHHSSKRRQRQDDGNNNNNNNSRNEKSDQQQKQQQRPLGVEPTMAFPAVALNSVKAFHVNTSKFEDSHSSDVVRLVCVLARHFRSGTTVDRLMETLGDRRRVLIAIHEAAAANLVSVRLETGTVRLML